MHTQGTSLESEKLFKSLYENAPLGIYQTAPDGQVLMANPALLEMLDYSLEEMKMKNLSEESVKVQQPQPGFNETVDGDEETKGIETVWLRRDGTQVLVRENTRCIRAGDGSVLYYEGTVEDITESKQVEEHLQQSQKMEAIGQLAGGVAHDFNNILTIINGYTDLALRSASGNDKLQRHLEEIKKAAERASEMTNQLLAFSRKQVLQVKILNPNFLIGEINKKLQSLISQDIDFVTILQPDLGNVKADPEQIEQVILNLISNALDAMPTGGKLILETAEVQINDAEAQKNNATTSGRYVMIAVSDTGIGMDEATQKRIFEPFFTTKGKGRGKGLGLSTVYGIVKQSDGHIKIDSKLGHGTKFKIYLPRVDEQTA